MSYSDYGGYIWKRTNKESSWQRQSGNEDASIKNLLVGIQAPSEQLLREKTGLKFDVLLAAQPNYGKDEGGSREQYFLEHAHHAVFGDEKVMVVMHKQSVMGLLIDDKIVWNDSDSDDQSKREMFWDAIRNLPEGYKFVEFEDYIAPGSAVIARLVNPDGEWMAVTGYGWGDDHWWQNGQRQEMDYQSKEIKYPWIHWPTAEECLQTVDKETAFIEEIKYYET
jgi:hypothetical protein